ncbi:MAG: TIGR04283 family arsenosugar biosynthesis glycosyltransferase [Phycisphaerales bacterium]|nr:MAG: TIGR04283 family arsenosugar biosynthesis glycosyltransferase [Phycisphaerales bacterium]
MMSSQKQCDFSIIVPVLNEADRINSLIEHLRNQGSGSAYEIIVVDGDPQANTVNAIRDEYVVKMTAKKGRARQMNAGAEVARGAVLVFLHADTTLPQGALEKIGRTLENADYVGGAFDLKIDSDRLFLKYISMRASHRSRWNRLPYGDQAIFLRKEYFDRIGRFKDIPLMEDLELMQRIKKDGKKICILPDKVTTSARRWQRDGALYTTLRNQVFVALFHLGVSPSRLARYYWR